MLPSLFLALTSLSSLASAHISIFHPSMLGFNVTFNTFPYDNRPVSPLTNYTFDQWWMHGHLDYPPHPDDIFELPAGQNVTTELACTKSATSFFASSDGGDIRSAKFPDDPCPGSPPSEYHTTGFSDLKGCSLAIAYKSDFHDVQPEDFTVFSVNQTCVWNRFTDFSVPDRMPPCPNGKCICAWFWIHSQDSGGEQNYMTAFQCNVTGSTSNVPLAQSQVPRRCGADSLFNKPTPTPGNCTYGAKQPFYWFQAERNNMHEDTFSPPFYLDLYGFLDGPQQDIFNDSYSNIPAPGPNQTQLPTLKTIISGQRLPVPDLHLLPSNFLASVEAGAPTPTTFTNTPIAPAATTSSTIINSTAALTASSAVTSGPISSQSSSSSSAIFVSSAPQVTVTVTSTVTIMIEHDGPAPTASTSTALTSAPEIALSILPALANDTSDARLELASLGAILLEGNTTSNEGADASEDTSSNSRTCKQSARLLSAQSSTPTKRSLAERLGMGTYSYRKAHKRGLWALF